MTKKITECIQKDLSFVPDIWGAITELKEPNKDDCKPTGPADGAEMTEAQKMELVVEVEKYVFRKRTYGNNKFKVYSIILWQCSEAMKAKLEGQDDLDTVNNNHDLVAQLKNVKVWTLNQQSDRSSVLSTYFAITTLFQMRQQHHEDLTEFRKTFMATADVLKHIMCSMMPYDRGLLRHRPHDFD